MWERIVEVDQGIKGAIPELDVKVLMATVTENPRVGDSVAGGKCQSQ